MIVCVSVIKDIKAGEELFVDYGYVKGDFPWDHLWYHEAKEIYLKELKEKMKEKEEEMEKEKQSKVKKMKKEKKKKKKKKTKQT